MESWKRKLRMGMVGGGEGAFIGAVHRIAATLDQQAELVAGCFQYGWRGMQFIQQAVESSKRGAVWVAFP
jgi:hypothetical protein